jgi:hypothetical protein
LISRSGGKIITARKGFIEPVSFGKTATTVMVCRWSIGGQRSTSPPLPHQCRCEMLVIDGENRHNANERSLS